MTSVNSFTAGTSATSKSSENERLPVPLAISVWVFLGLLGWGLMILGFLKVAGIG